MIERLMIVDDDEILLEGLSSMVDWKSLNLYMAGAFTNGVEALESMRREPCSVLLTDIKMGRMDGLELADHVHQEFPDTRVVMMSAYDDFKFAQQAMRLGVEDYLLKPIELEPLKETMNRVVSAIQEAKRRASEMESMQKRISELGEQSVESRRRARSTLNTGALEQLCQAVLLGNSRGVSSYGEIVRDNLLKESDGSFLSLVTAMDFVDSRLRESGLLSEALLEELKRLHADVLNKKDFQEAVYCMLDACLMLSQEQGKNAQDMEGMIQRACSYIDAHFCESSLRIKDVAAFVGFSTNYFSAQFMQVTGESFTDYLQRKRMTHAQSLLSNTGLKTYEVACQAGYDNPSYFSTLFKRYCGMTVSQYRQAFGKK